MAAKKDRTVYQTPDRQAQRGLKASAMADGYTWIPVEDGSFALYANTGIAERFCGAQKVGRQRLAKGVVAYRCLNPQCGYARSGDPSPTPRYRYTEASLICVEAEVHIPPRPTLCVSCKEDTCALHALELQEAWGINLGWRRRASLEETEFYTRRERLLEMGRCLDSRSGMGEK